ncbi:hypothetical protein CKO41_10775 [Thiococcus pfennigii]|nr:hypothetical protein [Thiococcus pfennigii]
MGDLVEVLNLPDDGRSILGFLLIDHPATYYFDDAPADSFENLDVNILYLYADTLSLPIVTYLTYTKGSDTVRDYEARNGGGDKCQH